ncbi:MAG: hypothetical protein Fur0037_04410 [Planctomycetota bacterium]
MNASDTGTNHRIRSLAISDTGFVFDPRTGHSFTANATALCLLNAMKQGATREQAAKCLRERFDTEGAEVEHDVDEFLRLLREQGLLPRDGRADEAGR